MRLLITNDLDEARKFPTKPAAIAVSDEGNRNYGSMLGAVEFTAVHYPQYGNVVEICADNGHAVGWLA